MQKVTKIASVGGLAVLVLAITFVVYRFQSDKGAAQKTEAKPAAGVPSARSSDPVWHLLSGLAYLDLHPPVQPPSNAAATFTRAFDTDPERTLQGIEKRITLVPYEGSLAGPTDLPAAGLANSLDRAQLVQTVLKSSGIEARIVSISQDGKIVFAKYPAATPVNLPPVKPDVLEALRKEVAQVSPLVLAKLKSQNGEELYDQLLKIGVAGPGRTRYFERVLVGLKGDESPSERLLEIATRARITVLTRSLSDEEFKRGIAGNLVQCASLVFGKAAQVQSGQSANFISPAAIAVLDTSHRAAGGLGEAGRQILAFQGRPAFAFEHDFLQVNGNGLERRHSFDLIDPGHSLYAPNAGKDALLQAAIEQSVADAWLEERVTSGKTVITSRRAVRDVLASKSPLNISKPPSMLGADTYGTVRPAYLLGAATQGKVAGWRFDPGPQLVPVLWNYTGGTESADTPVARVQQLCKAIPTGLLFVPTEMFPQKFLAGGLVKYDCALAATYVAAAARIDIIAQQIGREAPASPGPSDDDFEEMIHALGPELVKHILLGALGQTAAGLAVHGVLGEGPEHPSTTDEIINYLAGVGSDYLSDKAAEKLKEYLDEIQKSSQEGKSPEQIERDIAKEYSPR